MILVADSGSSKTDWILQVENAEPLEFESKGINPFFLNEKEISRIIFSIQRLPEFADKVTEVHFFGAGCTNPDRRETVSNVLSQAFKNAFINVENDILGRAYATSGKEKGIISILGTGSNIAYYDGQAVVNSRQGLGFILGDEGSGTYFGKKLLTSYLYDTMPRSLKADFKKTYNIDKELVIRNVYQKPAANIYLSSFARFLSKHRNDRFILELLELGFEEFIETNRNIFSEYKGVPAHFVGSVSFHFQDVLKAVCKRQDIVVGKVLTHPIKELYKFIVDSQLQNAN